MNRGGFRVLRQLKHSKEVNTCDDQTDRDQTREKSLFRQRNALDGGNTGENPDDGKDDHEIFSGQAL
jgi:hypothetical protein